MKNKPETWEALRTRLLAQMTRRGISYSEAALELGERVQRVSTWLNGGQEPRTDIGLRFLTYLEKLEASK